MVEELDRGTMLFPDIDPEDGYWHMHLPVRQAFINSDKTPSGIKRLCVQKLVDCTERLVSLKPKLDMEIRVAAFINFPDLWYSEIIVFFGEKHYRGYFYRNNSYQTWIPLDANRNIAKEMGLKVPESFKTRGYKEILNNDDLRFENELWYLGEIG